MDSTNRDIYDMMDELDRRMSYLRRNYPSLFPSKALTLEGSRLSVAQLAEAFVKLGEAFVQVHRPLADFTQIMEEEQARQRQQQQAGWRQRLAGWLRSWHA